MSLVCVVLGSFC